MMPTLEEFLSLPYTDIAKIAPVSLGYAPAGTRRAAALQGIDPRSAQYLEHGRASIFQVFDLLFRHGVQNIFSPIVTSSDLKQIDQYVAGVIDLALTLISDHDALAYYHNHGWRVRLLHHDRHTDMSKVAQVLENHTAHGQKTLYWTISKSPADLADKNAVRAIRQDNIDPISLYIGFGKPTINAEIVPPSLIGNMQCYWTQTPGYSMTEQDFRSILYDYAYTRQTSHYPKADRAMEFADYQQAWENLPTLGIGIRVGKWWIPAKQP